MVGDLRQGDEGEAHAQPEQAAGAGDVGDAGHLLSLGEGRKEDGDE